jgi:hypothetical protein
LIVSRKEGRKRQLYFNAVPIQMIHDRWTTKYSALWAGGLTRIKYRIESLRSRAGKRPGEQSAEAPAPLQRKRHA